VLARPERYAALPAGVTVDRRTDVEEREETPMRRLTYYVAVSIDGFIAAPDGSDFFSIEGDHMQPLLAEYPETVPAHVRTALGLPEVPSRHFDTVLMGRRSYEPALREGITSPYPHLDQHVFSRSLGPLDDPAVTVVDTDPVAHVRRLKERDGLGVWLCGGGTLAGVLREEIDELVLKVNPVLVGSGRPMLEAGFAPQAWTLVSSTPYASGVVVQHYRR
jgi:dihydrofolate reductase